MQEVDKFNYAVNDYKKFGKTPEMPYRAFVNYADTLFKVGCIEDAEEMLHNAANFAHTGSDALINLGMIKQAADDHHKAIEYFKKAFKKDPKNTKALCLWGNSLTYLNNTEGAVKKYQQAISLDERSWEAYVYWGLTLMSHHKFTEAKEKLEKAVEYNPKDVRALFMLASVETELGLYDEALLKFTFLIHVTENNYGAYHNIAYIYFKKKMYDKTIEYAQRTIGMAPKKPEAYLLLGDTYLLTKKYDEALGIYECAEKNNIKSLFLYISWGSVFQMRHQYEEAIEKYLKGLELCPDQANDEVYARLGRCYMETGETDEAKIYALKALELEPENFTAQEVIADIYLHTFEFQEALKALNICLKNSKAKAITYYKMALCYDKLFDYEQAKKHYEKSVEYDRENENILFSYIQFLVSQNKIEEADSKMNTLEKISKDKESLNILQLSFIVNYNIAKGNIYGYNGMKAIAVADKIKEKYPESFRFEDEYRELTSNLRE